MRSSKLQKRRSIASRPIRYAVLYRIDDAKTEKTRAVRLEKFVAMLACGETIYPQGA
jgi:uncharacterized protein YdeI (YjbR/CyaY-like superfamily)